MQVVDNPSAPVDLLTEWAKDEARDLSVADNPILPLDAVEMLVDRSVANRNGALASRLLERQDLSEEQEASLEVVVLEAGESYARSRLASDPSLSPESLSLIAKAEGGDTDLWVEVALNPNSPSEVLMGLYSRASNEARLRRAIASNLRAGGELLELLGADELEEVRNRVAGHPAAPKDLLKRLADDSAVSVRAEVAANGNIEPALMRSLAMDPDLEVRFALAHNPNAGPEILEILFHDPRAGPEAMAAYVERFVTPFVDDRQDPTQAIALMRARREAGVRY